jgi:hypothetical protein
MNKVNSDIEKAKFALDNQIGWQKYATSKILLLFSLSGGTLIVLINGIKAPELIDSVRTLPWNLRYFLFASLASLVISIIPHCLSFSNYLELKGEKSIISWNTVKNRSLQQLIKGIEDYTDAVQLHDILNEHLAGSKITAKLHFYFGFGILVYIAGLICFLIPMVN